MAKAASKKKDSTAKIGFEAKLWLAADKLRNNMDAAEYKHVVLGLIFLKYISDAFEDPSSPTVLIEIQQGLDDSEWRFLLSLVVGTPDWSLLGIDHLEQLPGIRWKLRNLAQLQKTNAKKFAEQVDTLAAQLASSTLPTAGRE